MTEGYVWIGRLPQRKSWYLYLECGVEIIPLARFLSAREASTLVEEPVKDGVRYRIREWPEYTTLRRRARSCLRVGVNKEIARNG